ncbi:probable LRR receptor-like serine threonine-kinase At1g67720 [Olea europaea subsp. europaea]|uniref:Probable LRR receptor-like serine threonine-kinase At1g67720 n=1 Tax=Olea europaea subsp. europaea TaxID=158383 RepID=A0A8S0PV21_OLEEU|nr:probable LRR receptor-like serine threonine-kinase At1g67720 [Olea europaea subsp. europaea]
MGVVRVLFLFLSLYALLLINVSTAQMPGFVSLDCGGKNNFTDELGLEWTPDNQMIKGEIANISVANEMRTQYRTVRYFPADNNKYCYTLRVISRTRYLVRATFLYGDFDNNEVYPKFDISFGPTHWATIVISDANTIESQELIFLATDPTISICLSNATTGQPFISTLELRQFNGSIYMNQFENEFFLSVSARINFGAESDAPVRFPDDPFDRIWESDSVKKANYLVDVAPGTEKISTNKPIDVSYDERPPQTVMQTAVVGRNGSLTYRLNLDGFPGFGWAFSYFAEIEDLSSSDIRKFRFILPGDPDLSKAAVNIQENAQGSYRLYEPGYDNISLPFVLSFRFGKTSDSTMGPLLNAMEINKYLKMSDGSLDGFVSLDCGGKNNFTDELGLEWTPDNQMIKGEIANISVANEMRTQYRTVRYFPADNNKYCYTLRVISRTRYLVRATFLYGDFDNNEVYPKFDISFGPTHWATIVISDANTIESQELIFLATDPTISICLSNATTGQPFISTLELRQFNGSIYMNQFENEFFLSVSARINFGAESDAPVRFPDDPFDRIWESDSVKKANYLVDVAPGTEKISTNKPIDVSYDERPPQTVMQTAVVGRNGSLTYRLNLDGFPGFGWAFSYFAEIEDLSSSDIRKFRFILPGDPDLSKAAVNIQENAQGSYRLYEPGYDNISLPFVLSFRFGKTSDSTMGPLLNAMEINKYLKMSDGSLDGPVIAAVTSAYSWAEGGDPCLPVPWSWVKCNSEPQPRIVSIKLSGKNLTGGIPSALTKLSSLVELWLDKNSLSGSIPDFSGCPNLKELHLENNQLTGELPSSLADLPNLKGLYVQNNMLSGRVPSRLLDNDLILNFTGNTNLHKGGSGGHRNKIIIGSSVGAAVLLIVTITSCILLPKGKKNTRKRDKLLGPSFDGAGTEAAHCYTLSELEDATNNFERKVGSGGFGVVYYGKLKHGKEIAVKVLTNDSFQGKREFSNEVALLSRIHHRNLLHFLGYCQDGKDILVYEFMHNGTLKEHLYGKSFLLNKEN